MVTEGVEMPLVDNAARLLGFPVGPLQLTDETSIDLGVKIAKATKAAMGNAYDDTTDEIMFWMADNGRLGRKAKAGFFDYDEKGKRQGYSDAVQEKFPAKSDQPDVTEVQHRLMMAQVLEAVRALEENVLMDIREGDVGAILGWGFAPWSGGPFSWLDMLGAAKAVEICDHLTETCGERFTCPALLRDMATKGETFYGRFGAKAKAA
jgi:3-hydroxyacyl-CoA dehydrogenase/enoyl-CoA hydratase/3-hydroxybutyryl-CoA epimerase